MSQTTTDPVRTTYHISEVRLQTTIYAVEAPSPEAALYLHQRGETEFVDEVPDSLQGGPVALSIFNDDGYWELEEDGTLTAVIREETP